MERVFRVFFFAASIGAGRHLEPSCNFPEPTKMTHSLQCPGELDEDLLLGQVLAQGCPKTMSLKTPTASQCFAFPLYQWKPNAKCIQMPTIVCWKKDHLVCECDRRFLFLYILPMNGTLLHGCASLLDPETLFELIKHV